MTNNDILRRIRFALDQTDAQMVEISVPGGSPSRKPSCSATWGKPESPALWSVRIRPLRRFSTG